MAIEQANDIGLLVATLKVFEPPPAEPEPEVSAGSAGISTNSTRPDQPPMIGPGPGAESADASVPRKTPRLQGIIRHPREPLAIVNGRTLGIGETADGYRLHRILDDRVIVIAPDGSEMELRQHEIPGP